MRVEAASILRKAGDNFLALVPALRQAARERFVDDSAADADAVERRADDATGKAGALTRPRRGQR